MIELPVGLAFALRNLGAKAAGDDVEWINIADARLLTELGYAARSRQGWTITAAGKDKLAEIGPGEGEPPHTVSHLPPRSVDRANSDTEKKS